MAYGSLALDEISTSGNLAIAGDVTVTGNVTVSADLFVSGFQVEPLVLATAQTASGTSVDFTGIPSWVKRITVMFTGLSSNGSDILGLRLATSSGLVSTGYFSVYQGIGANAATSSQPSATTFFGLIGGLAASDVLYGQVMLTTMGNNIWTITGTVCRDASNDAIYMNSGAVTLSSLLTSVSLIWSGTNTFDAGTINIMYE
jgi:hypothetical protein